MSSQEQIAALLLTHSWRDKVLQEYLSELELKLHQCREDAHVKKENYWDHCDELHYKRDTVKYAIRYHEQYTVEQIGPILEKQLSKF